MSISGSGAPSIVLGGFPALTDVAGTGRPSQRARDAGGGLMIPVNGMCCGYHSMAPWSALYALSTEGFLKMTFSPGM